MEAGRAWVLGMGSNDADVWLASPYTVAASAVAGHIVDPRDLLARTEKREAA